MQTEFDQQLIAREDELAVLERTFDRCRRGRGGVVAVQGPVGVGKSELLLAFAGRVARQGAVLLSAAAMLDERNLPLGVISQFAGGPPFGAAAGSPGPVLDDRVRTILRQPTPRSTAAGEKAVAAGLLDAARRGPVVITVDDVQYADEASLECLLRVAERRSAAVLIVVVESPLSDSERTPWHERLLDPAHCRHLELGPLPAEGVARLLAAHLGAERATALIEPAAELTGGNPLLLRALIEDNRQPDADGPVVGEALATTAVRCLHRCGEPVVRLARAAAVLNEQATPARLSRLLGVTEPAVLAGIAALATAGLLGQDRFRHETIRREVLRDTPRGERADLHAAAAELLRDDGDAVASHLVEAGRPAPAWAVPLLFRYAETMLARGQADLALPCLELVPPDVNDERLRLQTFRAQWLANPSLAAMRPGGIAGPDLQAAVTGMLSSLWLGRLDEAADGGRHLATGTTAARVVGRLLTCAFPTVPGPPSGCSPDLLRRLLTRGRGPGVDEHITTALHSFPFDDPTCQPLFTLVALLYTDRPERSLLAAEPRSATPLGRAVDAAVRAEIALSHGDLPAALAAGAEAIQVLPPRSWGVAVGAPLALAVTAAGAAGRHAEAGRSLRQPVPPAMFETVFGLVYLRARGNHCLATGQLHAALDDFQTCRELMEYWSLDLPTLVPWRTDVARAYLRLGDRRVARELAREQLRRVGPDLPRTRGVTLRVLGSAVDDLDERIGLLGESANLQYGAGDWLELARSLRGLGHAQRSRGMAHEARLTLENAERLAERCGAELLRANLAADHQESRPRAMIEGRDGSCEAELSDSEQRVAELALRGRTNREIATDLHVTVSTIEQHLTRIYRKLRITGRSGLPGRLAARS